MVIRKAMAPTITGTSIGTTFDEPSTDVCPDSRGRGRSPDAARSGRLPIAS